MAAYGGMAMLASSDVILLEAEPRSNTLVSLPGYKALGTTRAIFNVTLLRSSSVSIAVTTRPCGLA